MTTGRTILIGVLTIGAIFGLGVAALVWLTGERPGRAARPDDAREAAAPPPRPAPPPFAAPALAPDPEAPPQPPPPSAAADAELPMGAPRRLPRGSPPPMDLFSALDGVRAELRRCPGASKLARSAAPQPGAPPRPGRGTGGGDLTVLLLQLEPQDGLVLVADAPVQSQGRAPPELIACARKLLVGQTFPASAARPGPRIPMQLVLEP